MKQYFENAKIAKQNHIIVFESKQAVLIYEKQN